MHTERAIQDQRCCMHVLWYNLRYIMYTSGLYTQGSDTQRLDQSVKSCLRFGI